MPVPLRRFSILVLVAILSLVAAVPVGAVPPTAIEGGTSINHVPGGLTGPVTVAVELTSAPLVAVLGPNAKQRGPALSQPQQQSYLNQLAQQQTTFAGRLPGLGGAEVARLSKVLNAVIVTIDAARVPNLAAQPGVLSVSLVRDYQLDLSETVPYIGATAVQENGTTGAGIKVAVLDSGVDYTHKNFGGPGTLAAYQAAHGTTTSDPKNKTRDGLFPTAKVYEGYDFVGESWPTGALAEDNDPIDYQGHGSHVADIAAGGSVDGPHKGVAPGATILAVKVCSAISSSCSGVALLKGLDYAVDPDGNINTPDAVDVINMSIGSAYGQQENATAAKAMQVVVQYGIVVVTSAGNNGDRPYITGSPGSAPEVISVAQTQVPSAKVYPLVINSPAGLGPFNNTNTVPWAPVEGSITAEVAYIGTACVGDTLLANPAGKIAIVLRATCDISEKVDRAADAGAVAVLVQNNAPGDPPSFSLGNGDNFVPTLILSQADGNTLRAAVSNGPVTATIDESVFTPLVGSIVSTSSRGPDYSFVRIKPDIGAPGGSLSAQVGTGDGETAFSGTSGAAPMVAGAVALLLQAKPGRTPGEVKAVLMNTAETNITTNPLTAPGVLAPITRIGGGEVRINKAIASQTAVWDTERLTGSLSFGYQAVSAPASFSRTVTVRNYANVPRTYTIGHQFRYNDDAASGAVTIGTPTSLNVPANGSANFTVQLSVDASKLPTWALNGGLGGGDGSALQAHEFDGYITVVGGGDDTHVAFHILPHKSANVAATPASVQLRSGRGSFSVGNPTSAIAGNTDIFALTGVSPQLAGPPPAPGSSQARIDLKAIGVRQVGNNVQFGITTWGERAHPVYPAEFDIYIDSPGDGNLDGNWDYVIYNAEFGGSFGADGRTAVYVQANGAGSATAYFYVDASLNSANAIFTVPLSVLGMTAGQQFKFHVQAYDNYFTGTLTDSIGSLATPMTHTLNAPRYSLTGLPGNSNETSIPVGSIYTANIRTISGGATTSPSQVGFLFLYRDGKIGREADTIVVTP